MSATETATRVLQWAIQGAGPPPQGDLREAGSLWRPDSGLTFALREICAITAARLRLGSPPMGDPQPLTAETGVVAAALGMACSGGVAMVLLGSLAPARGGAECVARHGLVRKALPFVDKELADELRLASPLTALLEHPAAANESEAMLLAQLLIGDRAGRLCLSLALAEPTSDSAVRRWRANLLQSLRLDSETQPFVLDVYEAAMVHHELEHLRAVHQAHGVLGDLLASADEERLSDSLATAEWWGALSALEEGYLDALRERRYLGYHYRQGLTLHRVSQHLLGVAS